MEALKNIERKYLRMKGRVDFLRLIKNPSNTENIIRMGESLRKGAPPEQVKMFMEKIYDNPQLENAFQEKYWPHMPTFTEMEQMPEGSFGHEFTLFIKKWNLDKDVFPVANFDRREEYLTSRIYQAHDAWHVLTGYTPNVSDELALQAFGVGQYKQPISMLIISGGFIHILETEPERCDEVLATVTEGFTRGKAAKNLLTERVLERLADPIEEVRRDLGIIPRR